MVSYNSSFDNKTITNKHTKNKNKRVKTSAHENASTEKRLFIRSYAAVLGFNYVHKTFVIM